MSLCEDVCNSIHNALNYSALLPFVIEKTLYSVACFSECSLSAIANARQFEHVHAIPCFRLSKRTEAHERTPQLGLTCPYGLPAPSFLLRYPAARSAACIKLAAHPLAQLHV